MLDPALLVQPDVHFRLEIADDPSAFCLGSVERRVGAVHENTGCLAIVRKYRDPDTQVDMNLVAFILKVSGRLLQKAPRQIAGRFGLLGI